MAQIESSLLSTLTSTPHLFLQPTYDLQQSALNLAKLYFDPIASDVNTAQQTRLQAKRKSRKRRRTGNDGDASDILRLKRVHTQGFGVQQVWEQIKRITDAVNDEVELGLQGAQISRAVEDQRKPVNGVKSVRFGDDGFEVGSSDEEEDENEEGEDQSSLEDEEDSDLDLVTGCKNEEDDYDDEDMLEDDEEMLDGEDDDGEASEDMAGDNLVEDVHGLNDGFFSIDDFNRQTEFLEQVDARGDPDDGAASDEEDVDWDMNPMDAPLPAEPITTKSSKKVRKSDKEIDLDEDEESSSDEEGGPTFGDMDLNAPEGASDDEDHLDDDMEDDEQGDTNANDIRYKDFFAPPARKRNKKGPPNKHNFPAVPSAKPGSQMITEDETNDLQRTMKAVHRDLYSDEEDDEDLLSEDGRELETLDPADPLSRRSAHERRQAALIEEIRKLEAQNVSRRPWTLSGEASAQARPLNSLLEEDLDFERTGKPVPVITKEVSEDIEALIKRRILAREFDEVRRRRPDELLAISAGANGRRGALEEVSTAKSSKGLGQLYEEEHLKRTDPNYVDQRDASLKASHTEIENLWKDVSSKLDSLSSWNYRPKPVEVAISVRSDAPVVMMEDARPAGAAGGADVALQSQLAPQEIYKTGGSDKKEDREKGEVVTKGGTVLSKEELSRDEKQRLRKREKERYQKKTAESAVRLSETASVPTAGGKANGAGGSKKSKERQEVVNDLKRGGVQVIGKKGELVDVDGKKSRSSTGQASAGAFKL